MERIKIEGSKNVVSVGYDVTTRVLEVEFPGQRLYQYDDVPGEVAEALVKAESVGGYLHANVKANYVCRKVDFTP